MRTKPDILILCLFMCGLFMVNVAHRHEQHKEVMTKLNRVDSLYTEISEHNHFVDSMHYSKCAFALREGVEPDSDN